MSDEELARHLHPSRGRRMWDHHGSWIMVIFMALLCYMTGVQHMAYNATKQSQVAADLYAAQDDKRAARIRELLDENQSLRGVVTDKATAAAESAKEAVDGVKQIIQNQPATAPQ